MILLSAAAVAEENIRFRKTTYKRKQYDPNNPVGVSIVRVVAGVHHHDKVIVVTTSRFTKGAFKFAQEEQYLIQLMDLNDLRSMVE